MNTEPNLFEIRLAQHPAGSGFYGEALQGDTMVQLDILPPAFLWAGDAPLHADPTHWRVYADGSLIGRIEREEDVGPALLPLLATRPSALGMPHSGYNTEQPR